MGAASHFLFLIMFFLRFLLLACSRERGNGERHHVKRKQNKSNHRPTSRAVRTPYENPSRSRRCAAPCGPAGSRMDYLRECVVRCGRSSFAVDSWRTRGCGAYFLTHAHADHLVGLSGARAAPCAAAARAP